MRYLYLFALGEVELIWFACHVVAQCTTHLDGCCRRQQRIRRCNLACTRHTHSHTQSRTQLHTVTHTATHAYNYTTIHTNAQAHAHIYTPTHHPHMPLLHIHRTRDTQTHDLCQHHSCMNTLVGWFSKRIHWFCASHCASYTFQKSPHTNIQPGTNTVTQSNHSTQTCFVGDGDLCTVSPLGFDGVTGFFIVFCKQTKSTTQQPRGR